MRSPQLRRSRHDDAAPHQAIRVEQFGGWLVNPDDLANAFIRASFAQVRREIIRSRRDRRPAQRPLAGVDHASGRVACVLWANNVNAGRALVVFEINGAPLECRTMEAESWSGSSREPRARREIEAGHRRLVARGHVHALPVAPRAGRPPVGVLSGGEQQMLTIALSISQRLYVMGHGRIVFEGTPDDLTANPDARREWREA
jgi:hypothetical protein